METCFNLGVSYESGKGVEKNFSKAVEIYNPACENSQANACSILGNFYDNGEGLEKDTVKARALYKKACNLGDKAGYSNNNLSK